MFVLWAGLMLRWNSSKRLKAHVPVMSVASQQCLRPSLTAASQTVAHCMPVVIQIHRVIMNTNACKPYSPSAAAPRTPSPCPQPQRVTEETSRSQTVLRGRRGRKAGRGAE